MTPGSKLLPSSIATTRAVLRMELNFWKAVVEAVTVKVGEAKLVHRRAIEVFTIVHLKGSIVPEYQSKPTKR